MFDNPAGVANAASAAISAIPATFMSSTCLVFQPLRRLPVPLSASQICVSRLRYVVHQLLDALAVSRPLFRSSLSPWHPICWHAAALHLHVEQCHSPFCVAYRCVRGCVADITMQPAHMALQVG